MLLARFGRGLAPHVPRFLVLFTLLVGLAAAPPTGQAQTRVVPQHAFSCLWAGEAPPDLCAVDLLTASDGWAVGAGGRISHWNGRVWADVTSPVTTTLRSVSMVSPTDGWAAGNQGTLVRWNGVRWAAYPWSSTEWVRDIHMRTATDGWLVTHRAIWHWDGTTWTRVREANNNAIEALSATEVWTTGFNPLRWDGTTWHETGAPGTDNYALKAFSATDAWVGGLACLNESCGGRKITLARRVGQEWVNLLPETWDGRVLAIDGVASNDVWALGDYGDLQQGYLRAWHWDGVQLTAYPIPTPMNGVAMVTATDGWAVGPKGEIIHWDGTAWRPYVPLLRQTYLPLAHR